MITAGQPTKVSCLSLRRIKDVPKTNEAKEKKSCSTRVDGIAIKKISGDNPARMTSLGAFPCDLEYG
jgi:hypothetical protein